MIVIADFDNYFYAIRRDDPIAKFNENKQLARIFTWETTTSNDASAKIPENMLKPETVLLKNEAHLRPKYIYLRFWDRSFWNKVFWSFYRLLNLVYTSVYYYWLPFIATFSIWLVLINES